MARLIDANEITYYTDEQGFECAYKVDIDNLPTINPERLRPMAHWVHKQTKLPGGVLQVEECSLCECQMWRKTNFCPDCGARMKMED